MFNADISNWIVSKVTNMYFSKTFFLFFFFLFFSVNSWIFFFPSHSHTVFHNSGFKRTLCGSTWSSITGTFGGFETGSLGTSTARLGCCPSGSYMSDPFFNPFGEADSCSTCPANQFATTSNNDDLSCCASVTDGSCTACNSAIASGCTVITCDTGFVSVVWLLLSLFPMQDLFLMQENSFLIHP